MKFVSYFIFLVLTSTSILSESNPNPSSVHSQISDQQREKRALHKRKVREKLYSGASVEGELFVQPDLITTREKRKQEKQEREEAQ